MKGHALIHSGKWEGHDFFPKKKNSKIPRPTPSPSPIKNVHSLTTLNARKASNINCSTWSAKLVSHNRSLYYNINPVRNSKFLGLNQRCFCFGICLRQIERESAGFSPFELKTNSRFMSHGRFWMWRWRMDTSHED